MKKITINLTQHSLTSVQRADGVRDWPTPVEDAEGGLDHLPQSAIKEMLVFDASIIDQLAGDGNLEGHLERRAATVARETRVAADKIGAERAMVGGAPWFQPYLLAALRQHGLKPCWALSDRRSVEQTVDGKTVKKMVFQHVRLI